MYLQYVFVVLFGGLFAQNAAVPTSRIVHGNIAAKYQFPWHVSLTISYANSTHRSYCGGSLISSRYILTAATCLLNAASIKADFGSISFSTPLQSLTTTKGMIHPQFQAKTNANNIAIIQLNEDVWYTNDKRAILLAGQSQASNTFVNTTSYISGFGVAENGDSYLSASLRYAFTTVITNDLCQHFFPSGYVRSETMCTLGYINSLQSGCYGDQGGALTTNIDGTWYQIGLISTIHGGGCTGNNPNLYTRIAPYVQWINQMTGIPINP